MEEKLKQNKGLPPRVITVSLLDNKYEIKYPTAGQFIDIESRKILFSNRQYASLIEVGTVPANKALDIIECISYFSVLVPALKEDLRVKSIFELDLISMQDLINVYKKELLPWLREWEDILNAKDVEIQEDEEDKGNDSGD